MIDEPIAQPAGDVGLQTLDLLGLELDHSPAPQIDQMVVVRLGDLLVPRAAFAEIMAFDDAGVLEQSSTSG